MTSWGDGQEPAEQPIGPMGWALGLIRLLLLAIVIYGLMIVLAITRLIEGMFKSRDVSPFIVQAACKASLFVLGFQVEIRGQAMKHKGALVCNHASWLDVFSLNAAARVFFVSKAEVSKWPAIGLIARSTGTIFIERKPREAKRQKLQFEERLNAGDRLLFFPEGTSTDGLRVVEFKSTLFAAFFDKALADHLWIQPTSLIYKAPSGEDARFYGWWGDMSFGHHFLKTLGAVRNGGLEIIFHDPVRVSDFNDRKALAQYCETTVRTGLEGVIGKVTP